MNFYVECDRAKCKERVGENGIEIGLTVWILHAKWWNEKIGKYVLSDEHGPCVWLDIELHDRACCQNFFFAFLSLFHYFLFWIDFWCKHEKFRYRC